VNQEAFELALEALTPEGALRQEVVAARMAAGLSQAELAERMGTSQPTIARMEAGRSSPSFGTLKKLAKATGSRLVIKLEAVQKRPDQRL